MCALYSHTFYSLLIAFTIISSLDILYVNDFKFNVWHVGILICPEHTHAVVRHVEMVLDFPLLDTSSHISYSHLEIHFGPFCLPYFTKRSYSAMLSRHTPALLTLSIYILMSYICVNNTITQVPVIANRGPPTALYHTGEGQIHTHSHTNTHLKKLNLRVRPCGWFIISYSKGTMRKEQDCDVSVLIHAHTHAAEFFWTNLPDKNIIKFIVKYSLKQLNILH